MPVPPPSGHAYGQPSCWTRMKTGFTIGFCVGLASGAIFGGFSALRGVPAAVVAMATKALKQRSVSRPACCPIMHMPPSNICARPHQNSYRQTCGHPTAHTYDVNTVDYKIWSGLSRYGFRGRELLNTVGKAMIQGGGTFGTFMAIGTGIRC